MDVQFNEESVTATRPSVANSPSGLSKLVIGWGLAKDEQGAQKVLLGVLVLVILATILVLVFGTGGDVPAEPLPTGTV